MPLAATRIAYSLRNHLPSHTLVGAPARRSSARSVGGCPYRLLKLYNLVGAITTRTTSRFRPPITTPDKGLRTILRTSTLPNPPYTPDGKTRVTKSDIIEGLRGLGIGSGDTVFFHNSLSSMGYVEGGAETVIDGFLDTVGPKGTVAVSTCHFNGWHYEYVLRNDKPSFDAVNSPSRMGRITEVLRHRPDAIRCLDSSNAMCAIGHHAAYLAENSVECFTPCGRDTAWGKLGELEAHYLFLGTGWPNCTMMHACEEYAHAPYTFMDTPSRLEVRDADGKTHIHVQKVHTPNIPRSYMNMEPVMQERELIQYGKLGDAKVTRMGARELIEEGTKCILDDPGFLLRDRGFLERCRDNQRGLIREKDRGERDV